MPRCRVNIIIALVVLLVGASPARSQTARILRFQEASLSVDTVRFDAGPVTIEYDCENIADKPVTILEVRSQCGCFTADFPKKAINPGEKAVVKARFDPHTLFGSQKRYLTVVATNGDYRKFNTLTLTGYVLRDETESEIRYPVLLATGLRSDVSAVGFRLRKRGEKPQRTLVLYNDTSAPMKIAAKSSPGVDINCPSVIEPAGKVEMSIILDTSGLQDGDFEEILTLFVDGKKAADVPLKGRIQP